MKNRTTAGLLLLLLPLFSLSQNRISETYHEHIDFTNLAAAKLKLQHTMNINSVTRVVQNKQATTELKFAVQKIQLKNIDPFLSFSCGWNEVNDEANNSIISIRFSKDSKNWDDWMDLSTDEHYERTRYSFASSLKEFDKNYRFYQIKITSNLNRKGNVIQYLFLNFFSPGKTRGTTNRIVNNNSSSTSRVNACNAPLPTYVTRAGWNCPQLSWSPSTTVVTHLIVHHAAGTNTSSDWGAVVLAIWNLHTGTNGYSDIGYNWLIAPNGVLYEGRYKSSTDNIQGAHFCGTNGNTMGVCMLGDYTSQTISTAARNTLVQVLGWKACERNIDALATSFHANSGLSISNISGHRDGCATQCPGNTFYPDLPGVRVDVKNYLDATTPVTTIDGLEEFSISPNPVSSTAILKLRFNTVKEVYYRIVAADGRLVYQSAKQKVNGTLQQEIAGLKELPAAAYTLQLWANEQMMSRQFIKQ